MNGEKEITDGVQPICVGDFIAIKIDYDNNHVIYYNNDVVQGVLMPSKKLYGLTLYPCVDMSAGTEISFVNEPRCPLLENH